MACSWKQKKKKIPFLTSCVPNLGFDVLVIDEEGPRLEFDTDRCLGIDTEFVPWKSSKELRFPDRRITNQDDFEYVIDLLIEVSIWPRHLSPIQTRSDKDQIRSSFGLLRRRKRNPRKVGDRSRRKGREEVKVEKVSIRSGRSWFCPTTTTFYLVII